MQASKIVPESIYAVRRGKDELVRFHVKSITTTRSKGTGSPHDFRSYVSGFYVEDHTPGELPESIKLDPEKILGPYEDYIELVQRKKQEEAARQAAADIEDEKVRAVARALYHFVDQPVPNKLDDYKMPFRVSYKKIEIDETGQALLLAAFKKHSA
jgi:hypothetical protein